MVGIRAGQKVGSTGETLSSYPDRQLAASLCQGAPSQRVRSPGAQALQRSVGREHLLDGEFASRSRRGSARHLGAFSRNGFFQIDLRLNTHGASMPG